MNITNLTELSRNLSSYQKGQVLAVLRRLSNILSLETEKDLGSTANKKRLTQVSGKNINKLLADLDTDREFLRKIFDLLEKETIILPTKNIIVDVNEVEEERYGSPILILFPLDFEDRRKSYEKELERLFQEKVRDSITSTAPVYQEPTWWSQILTFLMKGFLMVLFVPLYLFWSGGKKMAGDVWSHVYKGMVVLIGGFLLYQLYQWVIPLLQSP